MNDTNIIRIVKGRKNPYSMIANQALTDKRLSFKARGILALCLSRPDDWQFNATYLENMSEKDGRISVRTGLEELEQLGYILRTQVRDPKTNQWCGSIWLVFEVPYAELYPDVSQQEVKKAFESEARQRFFEGVNDTHPSPVLIGTVENQDSGNEGPFAGFLQTGNLQAENLQAENLQLLNTDIYQRLNEPKTEKKAGKPAPAARQGVLVPIDPEETAAFSGVDDLYLKTRLQDHAKANGFRGARKFASVEQKARYREAVAVIKAHGGQAELVKAMDWAFSRDFVSRERVIDTLVRWAANLNNPTTPQHKGNGKPASRLLTHEQIAAIYG